MLKDMTTRHPKNGKRPGKKNPKQNLSGVERLRARGITPGNPGNSGGKPGRSGRKPDWFKTECEDLTDSEVLTKVSAYLKRKDTGPNDPYWWKCAEYVTGYGKGKPAQSVKVGPDEDAPPFAFTLNLGAAGIHGADDEEEA